MGREGHREGATIMSDEIDLIDHLLQLARRGWLQATAAAMVLQGEDGQGQSLVDIGHHALAEIEALQQLKAELATAGEEPAAQARGLLREIRRRSGE